MILQICAVISCILAPTLAAIGPGQNAYLPPKEPGYNYKPPQVPFPTQGPFRPTPRPFQPPSPGPFRPSTPGPYQPPRPTPPRPTYGPPSTFRPSPPPPRPFPPAPQPPRPFPPSPQPPRPTGPPSGPGYVVGQPSISTGSYGENDHLLQPHVPGTPFDFSYAVNDEFGNDYSHNAVNDGDVTRGEYRIQLPDGRTQIVKYTADWKTGFHAQVKFEGTPNYPQFQGRPSVQRPTQTYPSGPSQPGYPSGPSRPTPGYPTGPVRPTPSFPSPGPSRPGYPSGPAGPSQQYTPGGGYKY